jgi:hypothetical protein
MKAFKIKNSKNSYETVIFKDYRWLDDCPSGVSIDHWIEVYFKPWNKYIKNLDVQIIENKSQYVE